MGAQGNDRRGRAGAALELGRGLAILAMIGTSIYNFALSNGMEIMGEGAMTITVVIWVIALFLYFYATVMAKRRVLT